MAHRLLLLHKMLFDLEVSQRIAMILIVPHQGCLMADRSGLICSITVGTGGEVGWMRGPCACPSFGCDALASQKTGRIVCQRGQAQGPHPSTSSAPCPYRVVNVVILGFDRHNSSGRRRMFPVIPHVWLLKFVRMEGGREAHPLLRNYEAGVRCRTTCSISGAVLGLPLE